MVVVGLIDFGGYIQGPHHRQEDLPPEDREPGGDRLRRPAEDARRQGAADGGAAQEARTPAQECGQGLSALGQRTRGAV